MKKLFTKKILLFLCFMSSSGLLFAQQLLSDDFSYSGLLTANGWTAHSGGTTNAISTTTGLTYAGLAGSGVGNAALVNNLGGQDVNLPLSSQSTDGEDIYFSCLVNVTDPAATKSGDYFLNIGNETSPTSFTSFAARVFAKITATGVNFGVTNTTTVTYGTTNFTKNTTYLLIVKYTISVAGSDPVSLWIIPSGVPTTEALAGSPEATTSATTGQNTINAIALRQGSSSSSVQTVVDALKVGLTWADVTGAGSVNPTLLATGSITNLSTTLGVASPASSYNLSGTNLTGFPGNISVTASAGFEVSLTSGSGFGTSVMVPYTAATLSPTPVYVRISAAAAQGAVTGTITNSGGGAASDAIENVSGGVYQNYYNTKANLGLNTLGTWSSTLDGSGASPADFTTSYFLFNIVNQTNANLTGDWEVTNPGFTSRVVVGDGTNPLTFTVGTANSISTATDVDVLNHGTLVLQNNILPFIKNLEVGSTVNFAQTGLTTTDTIKVPNKQYYNLNLTDGIKVMSSGTFTIRGTLTVDHVINFNGAPSPYTTINSLGDINFLNGTTFEASPTGDGNRLTLAVNAPAQTITSDGTDIILFRLKRDSVAYNGAIDLTYTSFPVNLFLGNNAGGGLQLSQGAATTTTLDLEQNTLTLYENGLSTATALGTITTSGGNISVLKAAGAASPGVLRFAPGSILTNLTMNVGAPVTSDSITIADDISVVGDVTLTNGNIVMASGKKMSLSAAASFTGGSATSFIDGTVSKTGATAFILPIGKGTKYAPVNFANLSANNTYTATYTNSGYGNYNINSGTSTTYPTYNVSTNEWWQIDQASAGTVDLTFNYTDASSNIFVPSAIRMAHFGGSDWNDIGGTPGPGNTGSNGYVTVTGVSSFSPFTFGATIDGVLPINLVSFNVQKQTSTVNLSWITAQEVNSNYFVVQRSSNGINWKDIGTVNAAGNSSSAINYSFTDLNPLKGINYYQLKQVDKDDKVQYSQSKSVLFSTKSQIIVAPNPASEFLNVYINKTGITNIYLYQANGKLVKSISTKDTQQQINVSDLSKGLYFIKIVNDNNVETQRVVIQ